MEEALTRGPASGSFDQPGGGEMRLRFTLERWCLWHPGAALPDFGWLQGEIIPGQRGEGGLEFLPMMQRRRLSPLARAAIAAAWSCRGEFRDLPAVFFSRHGESGHYFDMLGELAGRQELSPSRFSLSVHNAIAGLYSLCSETRASCVALAGGGDDLYGAFLEAAGMLSEKACDRLLLVFYDQPLPAAYREYTRGPDRVLALAMRLSAESNAGPTIELTRSWCAAKAKAGEALQTLCDAVLAGSREGSAGPWRWRVEDG